MNSFPIPLHPPEALGQQMFFVRKRSANAAAATCFCLCESEATATQHNVGHSVVATERGVLRLSSSISANVWTSAEK
ncbi:hypothetical protein [Lysinibacillus sp. CTST325]